LGENTTGEHWESETGKELDKKKDQYVRLQWFEPKQKIITTIITKDGLARDPDMETTLLHWRSKLAEKPEKGTCVLSKKKIGIKDKYIHVEFYNWEKPKTEEEVDVAFETIRNDQIRFKLDALKTLGKNPTFLPTIQCGSFQVCKSHMPTKNTRFNCGHIAFRFVVTHKTLPNKSGEMTMAPELYCKRAHPKTLGLPSEKELNWDVATAGTAIMLTTVEANFKRLRRAIKKNPKIVEEARTKFQTEIRTFEKCMGVSLGLLPDPQQNL